MDSTWFAVDEHGEVAFFETNEGGAVPEQGFPLGGEAGARDPFELDELLRLLLNARRDSLPDLAALLPDEAAVETLLDRLDYDDGPELAALLGLWVYRCEEQWAVPYERARVPAAPIHLEQLGELSARLRGAVLRLSFRDSPLIQPGEHAPVATWGSGWAGTDGSIHGLAPDETELQAELEELRRDWQATVEPAERPDPDPDHALLERVQAILSFEPPPPTPPSSESWMARLQRKLFGR